MLNKSHLDYLKRGKESYIKAGLQAMASGKWKTIGKLTYDHVQNELGHFHCTHFLNY